MKQVSCNYSSWGVIPLLAVFSLHNTERLPPRKNAFLTVISDRTADFMSSFHVCMSFRTHKSYHFLARFEFIAAVNINIVMLFCSFLRDAIYSGTSSKVSEILLPAFPLSSVLKTKAVILSENVIPIRQPAPLYILQGIKSVVSFGATKAVQMTNCR